MLSKTKLKKKETSIDILLLSLTRNNLK